MNIEKLNNSETRILSIDYGTKRVGLALSDPLKIISYPLKTIENTSDLFNEIKVVVADSSIEKIILGYPISDDEQETEVSKKILKLKARLENELKMEVILWDESFTSVMAQRNIIESVTKKNKRRDKGLVDSNAAAIILSEYLASI